LHASIGWLVTFWLAHLLVDDEFLGGLRRAGIRLELLESSRIENRIISSLNRVIFADSHIR